MNFSVENIKVKFTGVSGGHSYMKCLGTSEVGSGIYHVFMANKLEEWKIQTSNYEGQEFSGEFAEISNNEYTFNNCIAPNSKLSEQEARGMTTNERLFASGYLEKFDELIEQKNTEHLKSLLASIYLENENILGILRSHGCS
jgi:hypothetical protein